MSGGQTQPANKPTTYRSLLRGCTLLLKRKLLCQLCLSLLELLELGHGSRKLLLQLDTWLGAVLLLNLGDTDLVGVDHLHDLLELQLDRLKAAIRLLLLLLLLLLLWGLMLRSLLLLLGRLLLLFDLGCGLNCRGVGSRNFGHRSFL